MSGVRFSTQRQTPDLTFVVFLSPFSDVLGQYLKVSHGHFCTLTILAAVTIAFEKASFKKQHLRHKGFQYAWMDERCCYYAASSR
jgi:hypothetical protein